VAKGQREGRAAEFSEKVPMTRKEDCNEGLIKGWSGMKLGVRRIWFYSRVADTRGVWELGTRNKYEKVSRRGGERMGRKGKDRLFLETREFSIRLPPKIPQPKKKETYWNM